MHKFLQNFNMNLKKVMGIYSKLFANPIQRELSAHGGISDLI